MFNKSYGVQFLQIALLNHIISLRISQINYNL